MKILVTGATGLIGCHAVAGLLDAGHAVRVFVRDAAKVSKAIAPFGRSETDVEIALGSIEDEVAIDAALSGCDGLLHCAGIFSPDKRDAALLERTNVEGTRRVLDAAERAGLTRSVYVSSILALFPPAGESMTAEDEPTFPREMYAATKAAAERVAREARSRMPLSIVYPAAVQGPDDPTFSIGPQLVSEALASGTVLVTEGGLPSTDVRDLARLIVAIFEDEDPPAGVMAPAFFVPHDAYHEMLETLTGRALGVRRVPGWLLRAMGWGGDLLGRLGRPTQLTSEAAQILTRSVPVDDREACRLLGRDPIPAEASFGDLIEWMVEAGHLAKQDAGRLTGA